MCSMMPLTSLQFFCFCVFDCRKADVVAALKSLQLEWSNQSFTYRDIKPVSLNDCNWYPLTYTVPAWRICLFETKDLRTVMISNLYDGAHSLCWNLARKLGVESLSVRTTDLATKNDTVNELIYYNTGEMRRIVRTMTDPSWDFFEEGEPLWFEDVTLYSKRYKKDRMNRRILIDYCSKLGLEVDSPDFWKAPEATIVEIKYIQPIFHNTDTTPHEIVQ